ncbi:MAG: DpnD protein [Epsilonproteobacteria bacterium]|nr:DpnD protein [Campylobacterota bacterium]
MNININIQETLSRTVTVKAESIEDAVRQVEEMYKNEEIVLDYADFDGQVIIEKAEEKYKVET